MYYVDVCYQELPLFIRNYQPRSTPLGCRFFVTDQDINRLNEQAAVDVDPYCLVQKHLDAMAESIKKVRYACYLLSQQIQRN